MSATSQASHNIGSNLIPSNNNPLDSSVKKVYEHCVHILYSKYINVIDYLISKMFILNSNKY